MSGHTGGQVRGTPFSGLLTLPFFLVGLALSGFGMLKALFGYGLLKAAKALRW